MNVDLWLSLRLILLLQISKKRHLLVLIRLDS